MHSASQTTIFWAEHPALSLAAVRGPKTCHAPSAPRMARVHHRAMRVRNAVRHLVRHAVRGESLPERSLWAAGARPVRIPARSAALLLRKTATGLRALGLKPASLLRTAPASLPVPRSHRAPAGRSQSQNLRGGRRRKLAASARQKHFRRRPPALPRPTGGLFARVPSLMNKAASRSRCALDEAPHRSRLGALPPLSLVGTRDCFCRDRLSQRLGASFALLRLGAAHHGSPAWGPAANFRPRARTKVSCLFLRSLGRPARSFALGNAQTCLPLRKHKWAAGARPINTKSSSKPWINRDPDTRQCSAKSETKPR